MSSGKAAYCGVCGGRNNMGYHTCDPKAPGNWEDPHLSPYDRATMVGTWPRRAPSVCGTPNEFGRFEDGCGHFAHGEPCTVVVEVLPSPDKPGFWRRKLCGCAKLAPLRQAGEACPILVNARSLEWPDEAISYEDVVKLTFGEKYVKYVFSVVWHRRDEQAGRRDGFLTPGTSTKVYPGMVISAADTSNA